LVIVHRNQRRGKCRDMRLPSPCLPHGGAKGGGGKPA